jgi:acetyl-CoA acetyltransferase
MHREEVNGMSREVAIIGAGYTGFRALTPEVSYKELMYEAAVKAYDDAGVDPRSDIDSFVTVAEDFIEGTSIFDEYVPDQLGAVLKPVHTITGDGLHGFIAAYMQILTGAMDIVAVEGHSKASNVLTPNHIMAYAMDLSMRPRRGRWPTAWPAYGARGRSWIWPRLTTPFPTKSCSTWRPCACVCQAKRVS